MFHGVAEANPVSVAIGRLNFGVVVVGNTETLSDTITNHKPKPITISSIQGLGTDFQVTGLSLPLVLGAGQSVPFTVALKPSEPGIPVAKIAFTDENAQPYVSISAIGLAVIRGKLSASPSPIAFGNVQVGANRTQTVTLLNYGGTNLTIKQATLTGAAFSLGNISLPLTLTPGQTTSIPVSFAPTQVGNFTGNISFATTSGVHVNRINMFVFNLTGNGVSSAGLTPNPANVTFGNTQVGTMVTQTETITNGGSAAITLSQATTTGSGFSFKGPSLPLTLSAGQAVAFTVNFDPNAGGASTGSLTVAAMNTTTSAPIPGLNIPLTGMGMAAGAVSASPASPNFGNVTTGSNQMIPVTVSNSGSSAVTVSGAAASGTGFTMTGPTPPVTLNAGQSATFNVTFAPSSTGAASGTLMINSNASNPSLAIPLVGVGVAPGLLGSSPTTFSFGSVQTGSSKSMTGTLTNSGGTSLTISGASASGTGFSLSGLSLPMTLNAGQSASFTLAYAPTASGASSGTLSVTSNGSNGSLSVPLTGTGVTPGTVAGNPASLAFGNVTVGNNSTLSETLTNSGGSALTISAASASGSGFSLNGLSLPLTLNAGQSAAFNVVFTPTGSGAATGAVNVTSNGSNATYSIALAGTGVAAGAVASNPTSLAFGNVQVGNSTNLSETVTNSGGSPITINQANATGAGFSISGLTLPMTLNANQSVTFTATFAPTGASAASGNLAIISTASNSTLNIALSGTGTAAAGQLTVSPANLSFGNVTVGTGATQNGSVAASGSPVTISSASISSAAFAVTGISLPVTLAAGQSANFIVTFTPQSSGAASANLSFASNAATSTTVETMSGTGTAPVQHSVALSWSASSKAVGYNVYRSAVSGGPYTMINTSLDSGTSFSDNTVVSGDTYYYVATAVDSNSDESQYSNETKAVVPNP